MSKTSEVTFPPPSGTRVPIGRRGRASPAGHDGRPVVLVADHLDRVDREQAAELLGDRSEHLRLRRLVGDEVATRRSAACSSARTSTLSRALALEIAVATNSMKLWRRVSVSAANGLRLGLTIITPQSARSTEIGTPMEERIPSCRTVAAITPDASS